VTHGCYGGQGFSPEPLAQGRQATPFCICEPYPLPSELLSKELVLRPQVVKLLLQHATEPHCQLRCQELQRQRQHRAGWLYSSYTHPGARIGIARGSSAPSKRGEPFDITAILEDPFLAQDGDGISAAHRD